MPETTRPVAAPAPPARVPLSRVLIGERRIVVDIVGPGREELEREGLLPGRVVVVRTRTPLGGPLILELGRTRIALSIDVAERVSTVAATP